MLLEPCPQLSFLLHSVPAVPDEIPRGWTVLGNFPSSVKNGLLPLWAAVPAQRHAEMHRAVLQHGVSASCTAASLNAAHLQPAQRPLCTTQLPDQHRVDCCRGWPTSKRQERFSPFSWESYKPCSEGLLRCFAFPRFPVQTTPCKRDSNAQSHSLSTGASGEKATRRAGARTYRSRKTGGAQATVGSLTREEFHYWASGMNTAGYRQQPVAQRHFLGI